MRLYLLLFLGVSAISSYAQSDKDMIIASWKCVAIEQTTVQPTSKKQKLAPKVEASNIDSLQKHYLGVVYGFRNNGIVVYNVDGVYEARQYRVEGSVLTIAEHTYILTVYTILNLNYRTMALQDNRGVVYSFERE